MDVLYDDDHIIVVDKPHGLHTQPPAQGPKDSVLTRLQESHGAEVRLVHRLDRHASGLLVVARTQYAASVLAAELKAHTIRREYQAFIAAPLPEGLSGTIDLPLRWSGGRCWVDKNGMAAVTHFVVLGRVGDHTCLKVRLETGRMHQIRVHLKARLGSIVGDKKYGGLPHAVLRLRAVALEFNHPLNQKPLKFQTSD